MIIVGGIDLSIGSVICISAVATSYLAIYAGFGIGTAVLIAIGIALVVGVLQGALITRVGVAPFIITLGSMLLLRGVAQVLTGGTDVGFQGKFPGFRFIAEGTALGLPMPFWFAVAAIGLTAFLMHRTRFGRHCYAIGANAQAAALSGVPVANVRLIVFVAAAVLSGWPASSTSRTIRRRRRRSASRSSCTPSRRPCSAAARCRAAAGRCSASSSARASCSCRSTP